MSVYYCGKCGISAGTDDVFCHKCGTELNIEAVPSTEYAAGQQKICPQCGEPLPMGDRFCGKCGSGVATRGYGAQIQTKRRMAPSGITKHKRRRGFLFKLISAFAFWGVAAGALYGVYIYGAYKFLGSDIPLSGVISYVTGSESRTGGVLPAERTDVNPAELPPIVPDGDLPPIVPEQPDSIDSSDLTGPIQAEHIQAEPVQGESVALPKPEWGEQNADGYSALITPGLNEAGGAEVSIRGVVSGSRVNLRAEPNTSSQVLGQLSAGNDVAVTRRYRSGSEEYFWYGVSSGDNNGWMYGQYLRVEEE